MGQAKRKQFDRQNEQQAWAEKKRKLKRVPRALFYSILTPIWFPILVFILAMKDKDGDFPWGGSL